VSRLGDRGVLEIQTEGSGVVDVTVRGELDMHHAPDFRAAITGLLNRGDVTGIELDLAAVEAVDATGAGTLIVVHRIAVNIRVALRVCAVSASAAHVLTLLGAADLLPAVRPGVAEQPPARSRTSPDGAAPGGTVVPPRQPPSGISGCPGQRDRQLIDRDVEQPLSTTAFILP
jgi:anti-anti-sigma factor